MLSTGSRFDWQREQGFTLFEMMLVSAMIGILGSMAVLTAVTARERGRMAVFYSDIREAKFAAQRFEQDCGIFPLDVWRDVDPGLVEKYGWKKGGHSAAWETADQMGLLDGWDGPYLEKWKRNPWGGLYDYDNYPPGYNYMGIKGGSIFMSLKPNEWGGKNGMPSPKYERILEEARVDLTTQKYVVAVYLGRYPNWNNLPSH